METLISIISVRDRMTHRSVRYLTLVFLATQALVHVQAQDHLWHRVDQFQTLKEWAGDSSAWSVSQGDVRIDTRGYDQILASSWWIDASRPWTAEVEMRGRRSGLFFSLDDRTSKSLSHMVRFEDRTIMVGRFNGAGEFTATSTFDVSVDPDGWRRLRVDVDPDRNRVEVSVDGRKIGVDTMLIYPSGWFGLQASDGLNEFRSVVVRSNAPLASRPAIKAKDRPRFAHVEFLEPHDGVVCLYDARSNMWITPRSDGQVTRVHGVRRKPSPVMMANLGTKKFVIEGTRVLIMRPQGTRAVDSMTTRFARPFSIALTSQFMLISDPGANAVHEFDHQGTYLRSHRARAIGGFRAPRGMAVIDERRVAVADYDRVVIIEPGTDEPTLTISTQQNGSIKLQRSDRRPIRSTTVAEGPAVRLTQERDGSALVTELSALQTVRVRYSPAAETVPSSHSISQPVVLTAPPADKDRMAVRRLRLLYLVYRAIDYRGAYPEDQFPQVPSGRVLADEDIESLRRAVEFNRKFFFRHSSFRLALDFDFHVVDQPLLLAEVGDRDPYWLEPRARVTADVESAAVRFHRAPSSYDGVICTYAWQNHPPRRPGGVSTPRPGDTVRIRQAYGGGTYGVPAPWKYGNTSGYTGNPFQDRFSRQDWLITHEFHHQLDALMEQSGFPEYDHSDEPWKMPGAFGEDFDFNAQILRKAKTSAWMGLRFGRLTAVQDKDRDGVPDDEPTLPLDERRAGLRTSRSDSDGDGLSDLKELMAGTSDGKDREPLPSLSFNIGRMTTNTVPAVVTTKLGQLDVSWSMGWTPDSLVVEVRTSSPASVLFQLDADNDGWFHGSDNLQIRIVSEGDSVRVADAYLRDCSSWVRPPVDRKDVFTPDAIGFRSWRTRTASVPKLREDIMRFSIPRSGTYGRDWKAGKKVAVRFAVQTQVDLWVWDELFERNAMKTFTLK